MLDWFQVQTAGLWPLIWHYSSGLGVVGGALAFSWFSPVFKKTALWVALGALIITVSYGVGVSNGEARIQAKWDAAVAAEIARIEQARRDAERDISNGVRDPRDRPDN